MSRLVLNHRRPYSSMFNRMLKWMLQQKSMKHHHIIYICNSAKPAPFFWALDSLKNYQIRGNWEGTLLQGRSVWSTAPPQWVSLQAGTQQGDKGAGGAGSSRASEEHTRGLGTETVSFKHLLSPGQLAGALVTENFLPLYILPSLPVPAPGKDLEQKLDNRGWRDRKRQEITLPQKPWGCGTEEWGTEGKSHNWMNQNTDEYIGMNILIFNWDCVLWHKAGIGEHFL